eukprot:jgi/Botrbrau1/873/Bobra.0352s0062.1
MLTKGFFLLLLARASLGLTPTRDLCEVDDGSPEHECHPLDTILKGKKLNLQPPTAQKKPQVLTGSFGDNRLDDWYWLRDDNRTNVEVLGLLERENHYTAGVLAGAQGLQQEILGELRSRIPPQEQTLPQRDGPYWYYARREPAQQYPIHCRRPLPKDVGAPSEADEMNTQMKEEVLLDENREAASHDYFDLGGLEVTADHKHMVFGVDTSGSELYQLYVENLQTRKRELISRGAETAGFGVWAMDNRTLFYATKTVESKRPYRIWRYELGQKPEEATLVYEEPDESYYLDLHRTRSDTFLSIGGHSEITRYILYLDATTPTGEWKELAPKVHGRRTFVTHRGNWFYAMVADTNTDTLNGELYAISTSDPSVSHLLIPHDREVQLEDMTASARHLALLIRKHGQVEAYSYALQEVREEEGGPSLGESLLLDFGPLSESGSLRLGNQGPFNSDIVRLTYSDLRQPRITLDYNLVTGRHVVKKVQKVLGGYDQLKYRTNRTWAVAQDGVKVPISLVYRPDAMCPGPNRFLLYAYGAYGSPEDPAFDRSIISLLDRGFVYGLAHVRGGGDLGRYWHEDGKLMRKKNTFTDFVACAKHLIQLNWTRSDLLTIRGGSAGGLTMGAVLTIRPDLFRAAILDVPFVDVLTTMHDTSLPLTTLEFEEWGNPIENQTFYKYMKSYSPVDNVRAAAYPHLFVTAGLNDNRVPYWEPTKFVQKVREEATNSPLILFRINMAAGHFGVTGIYNALDEEAMKLTFLLLMTCAAPPEGSVSNNRCIPCAILGIAVLLACCALAGAASWQLLMKIKCRARLPSLHLARRGAGGGTRAPDPEKDILMGRLKS